MTPQQALEDIQNWLEIAYKSSMAEGKARAEPDKTYYWGEARAFRDAGIHVKKLLTQVAQADREAEENRRASGEAADKRLQERLEDESMPGRPDDH